MTHPGKGPWQPLIDELDRWGEAGRTAALWWRDDDAVAVTPALERLLALLEGAGAPALLAVIPAGATTELAAFLESRPAVTVAQHGYAHVNHAPATEKKQELGPHRPLAAVEGEIATGRERMEALFATRFLPVLVPPWNRVRRDLVGRLPELGLNGISTIGPPRFGALAGAIAECNADVDPIDWRLRETREASTVVADVVLELARRRRGESGAPVGIMSHHLVHDAAAWRLLEELLAVTADHPAIAWRDAKSLFNGTPRPV